jgi:hypothetical protein
MITERRRASGPVLGVLFVAGLTAMAFAQTPPALPEPKSPSTQIPEKIAPPLNSPGAQNGANQRKLERDNKPSDTGARTPVIPPPGSPGDNETMPK